MTTDTHIPDKLDKQDCRCLEYRVALEAILAIPYREAPVGCHEKRRINAEGYTGALHQCKKLALAVFGDDK